MRNRGMKHDGEARALFGPAYDSIPKSVFAILAYHFADRCGPTGADNDEAAATIIEEIGILAKGNIISAAQAKAAIRSLTPNNTGE